MNDSQITLSENYLYKNAYLIGIFQVITCHSFMNDSNGSVDGGSQHGVIIFALSDMRLVIAIYLVKL